MLRTYEQCIKDKAQFPELEYLKSLDWYEGWIRGAQSITESILHSERCYHGFYYVDSNGNFLTCNDGEYIHEHPEYREFRIKFYVKG